MTVVLGLDLSLTSSGWARLVDGRVVTGTLRPPVGLRGAARLSWVCDRVDGLVDGSSPALALGQKSAGAAGECVPNASHQLRTDGLQLDRGSDGVVDGVVGGAGSAAADDADGSHAAPVGLVVVEGYSFGSQGRATFSVGELGGAVRVKLFERGVPFVEVSPAVLKKFATGSGSAGKDGVLLAAARRGGKLFAGMSNDEADAFWLLAAGYAALASRGVGGELVGVPTLQSGALEKVDWRPLDGLLSGGAVLPVGAAAVG